MKLNEGSGEGLSKSKKDENARPKSTKKKIEESRLESDSLSINELDAEKASYEIRNPNKRSKRMAQGRSCFPILNRVHSL